jgi:hypothetical protein
MKAGLPPMTANQDTMDESQSMCGKNKESNNKDKRKMNLQTKTTKIL